MSEWFKSDFHEIEDLMERMVEYGAGAGQIVDGVLQGEGAQLIKDRITPLIPQSGRRWKGKGRPASAAMPRSFQQDNGQLSVTIAARNKWHYLYFPDDGSNTKNHVGNQQFMKRGAENAASDVIDLCVGKLTEDF